MNLLKLHEASSASCSSVMKVAEVPIVKVQMLGLAELRETVSSLLEEKKSLLCQVHEQQQRIEELSSQVKSCRSESC